MDIVSFSEVGNLRDKLCRIQYDQGAPKAE
jgi:hypothetical protein